MRPSEVAGWPHVLLRKVLAFTDSVTASLGLILLGMVIAVVFVVRDGGTPSAYAHFMYAPTILAAFRFRAVGGAVCGFLGGVLVGPGAAWLLTGMPYAEPSWMVRAAWIAIVGYTLGSLFMISRAQSSLLDWHLHTDRATAVPNLSGTLRLVLQLTQRLKHALGRDRDLVVTAIKVANYNDLVSTFGYRGADSVMRALSHRFSRSLSGQAIFGRTGTDELMVVEAAERDAADTLPAGELRRLIRPTLQVGQMHVYVDTVMGMARSPLQQADPEELFVQAAAAATRALERGASIAVYDGKEESGRRADMHLLGEVPRALREGEMRLVYQPKLDLATHAYAGLEALIRWQHPQQGEMSPARFIPLVEDTAMIEDLTRWVLREAINQSLGWRQLGDPAIAVNISSRNLMSGALLKHVEALLRETSLPPSSLELEVTETALTDIDRSHLHLLQGLREQGVRIAIDDFGTGYASLAFIRKLPVDILKLDRSFIQFAPRRPRERQMLKRIVQIAKDLELQVVGEGVEDRETLALLSALGCDQVQGFYISTPLEAADVAPVLSRGWSVRAADGG
ncbi:MAG: EAL domain-containing protein [Ectothiorhodospiraceae bacterium]|nr:EAL domain-containing protein [Ectothiorhodospiraceae bacterium]